MEEHLDNFAQGRAAQNLTLVYNDVHWLWGGVTILLSTDGTYKCLKHHRESIVPDLVHKTIMSERIQEILVLLHEIRAWEQQALERTPTRDEVRATLRLCTEGVETAIWDLYNKLEDDHRLVRVRKLLLELAYVDTAVM